MSRHAQMLLVIATLLLAGGATLVTHAIEIADATRAEHEVLASRYEREASSAQAKANEYRKTFEWYERPGNGTYATVKGGLINRLNYLVRKYQTVAERTLHWRSRTVWGWWIIPSIGDALGLIELNRRRKDAP